MRRSRKMESLPPGFHDHECTHTRCYRIFFFFFFFLVRIAYHIFSFAATKGSKYCTRQVYHSHNRQCNRCYRLVLFPPPPYIHSTAFLSGQWVGPCALPVDPFIRLTFFCPVSEWASFLDFFFFFCEHYMYCTSARPILVTLAFRPSSEWFTETDMYIENRTIFF